MFHQHSLALHLLQDFVSQKANWSNSCLVTNTKINCRKNDFLHNQFSYHEMSTHREQCNLESSQLMLKCIKRNGGNTFARRSAPKYHQNHHTNITAIIHHTCPSSTTLKHTVSSLQLLNKTMIYHSIYWSGGQDRLCIVAIKKSEPHLMSIKKN